MQSFILSHKQGDQNNNKTKTEHRKDYHDKKKKNKKKKIDAKTHKTSIIKKTHTRLTVHIRQGGARTANTYKQVFTQWVGGWMDGWMDEQ